MHCLSAREYRVGVDVVSDAVQVWTELIWTEVIWPFSPFDFMKWFDLTIWLVSGSTECRACWDPTNSDEYGTGNIMLVTDCWIQKVILLDLLWLTTSEMNNRHRKFQLLIQWSQHHDDIQGTLLLMGQVEFIWFNVFPNASFLGFDAMWCPGAGKVKAWSET